MAALRGDVFPSNFLRAPSSASRRALPPALTPRLSWHGKYVAGSVGNENDGPAVERSGAPDDERNQYRGRREYDHGFI